MFSLFFYNLFVVFHFIEWVHFLRRLFYAVFNLEFCSLKFVYFSFNYIELVRSSLNKGCLNKNMVYASP